MHLHLKSKLNICVTS